MMNKTLIYFLSIGFLFVSCQDDFDDNIKEPPLSDTQSFVYDGLNLFYLYKVEKEVLADDYFDSDASLSEYLNQFDSPEELFDELVYEKDRFSLIVSDFYELEKSLDGISMHDGMDYRLIRVREDSDQVVGYVRYVLPGTVAKAQGVERGMLFDRIDGNLLSLTNYEQLLDATSYRMGLATYSNGEMVSLNEEIELNKSEFTENPILIDTTYSIAGKKIGYLMYNSFTRTFDVELNEVFGKFKSEGIEDLIVDLRYNGGGSVESCKSLAGMITGQFENKLFAKQEYNENFPDDEIYFSNKLSSSAALNNLEMNRVYVLTSGNSASASELLINSLRPYIDVVQVGDQTTGKFQASTIIYDAPDFKRSSVPPGNTYAMLPLILKLVNADGFTDYTDGLTPDISYQENVLNMGKLGDIQEPLLNTALEQISGGVVAQHPTSRLKKLDVKIPFKSVAQRSRVEFMYVPLDSDQQ